MILQREKWIDVLKGIGAILVVIGHLVYYESRMKVYIYSFHMPIFFFVSGYLFSYDKNIGKFIKKKAKRLLLPYFFFAIISMIVSFIIDGIYLSKKEILSNILFINGSICFNSSLWFLIIMFFLLVIANLIFYIKEKYYKKNIKDIDILVTITLLVINILLVKFQIKLLFGLEIVPHALLIFYIGYLYKKNEKRISSKIDSLINNKLLLVLIGLVGLIFALYNGRINMSSSQYQNYLNYLFVAIINIVFYSAIAKMICSNKLLEKFSKLSLFMFCTQRIIFRFIGVIQNRIGVELLNSKNILINIAMISLILSIYLIYDKLKNKGMKYMKKKLFVLLTIIISIFGINEVKALEHGWQEIDGKYYYYDSESNSYLTGWQEIDGSKYYFDPETKVRNQYIHEVEGNKYFFGVKYGKVMYGWMNYDGLTYHMNEETGILDSGVTEVDGKHYFFGIKYNKLMYGLITDYDGDKYYTNNKGELQSGFHEIDGKVYYFDSKTYKALSGWQEIDGAKYYFDPETKVRAKGVTEVDGKYYFLGINSGKLMYGWINDSGTKYYSNETTGELVTGWLTLDGAKYYFDPNTKICASDVTEIDGKKYFFGIKYNKLMHGWVIYEDRTYYGNLTTGELLSDWQIIDGTKYFFGLTKNKLYKGWLLYPKDNKMYYLDPVTGIAVTGWKEIGGYMYYFDENSTYVTGNKTIDGMDYYFYEDGKMKSNFVTIDGKTYYYYNNGKKADDWTSIAGKKYFFNSLGVMIAKDAKKVIDVSSHQGTIDWDTVKAQGNVDGVILRISAGSAYEDTQLKRNVSELNRLGIPYGVYIYSYAEDMISTVSDLGTMHEGALEGARVVNAIKKYNMKLSLPIYYDLEVWENGRNRLWNPTMYTTIVKEFDKVLTSNGYTNWQIYTNKHWADTALNTPYLTERITWIAQYNHYCTYTGKYDMWQYSSTESIPGIKGNVDVNVLF